MSAEIVLATEALTKRFGALAVNDGVAISLAKGARRALIGPNGSGKTTLINVLAGTLAPTSGRILLHGRDVTRTSAERRVALGLARTFQITTLFPDLTPIEAVTMAVCQRRGVGGSLLRTLRAQSDAIDEAYALLRDVHLADCCTQRTAELAYGRQRLLEIALALAVKPTVLLLDEPAAGVPQNESAEILEVIARLPGETAVLFIEHDIDLVFRFAERITVLVAGRVLCEGTPAEIARDPDVRRVYLGDDVHVADLLAVDGLVAGYGEDTVLHDVAFAIPPGGSLAVLGRNGAGKSTLLLTLMGHLRARSGSIRLRGAELARTPPHRRVAAGMGWVPEGRDTFRSCTVDEHLAIAARPGPWNRRRVYAMFPRLQERRRNLGDQLSGGEQQMLAIGRALMTNPALLLLDEPLEGLAPVIVAELAASIRLLIADEGTAIVLIEQHARFALENTQSAIVLERGRVVHRGASAALAVDEPLLDRLIGMRRLHQPAGTPADP